VAGPGLHPPDRACSPDIVSQIMGKLLKKRVAQAISLWYSNSRQVMDSEWEGGLCAVLTSTPPGLATLA
jgi:hypothetical protein